MGGRQEHGKGNDHITVGVKMERTNQPTASQYDAISESWDQNRTRPFSALPLFALEIEKQERRGKKVRVVLDAGCGNARNTVWLCGKFPHLKASCCDESAGMLSNARKNLKEAKLSKRCSVKTSDIRRLGYPAGKFDAVLCTAVLHHLRTQTDRVQALREMRRVLKPAGFCFVTVWRKKGIRAGTDRTIRWPGKGGEDAERYYHFFSKAELQKAAACSGFAVAETFFECEGKKVSERMASRSLNLCFVLKK